ncbi:MAG: hypothetical protein L0J56_00325 [Halomonas sp.]|nr:hypothetical protein [Halomonas sp.]MDN6313733.1 hypothetical protein [Halomonas sp.]
MASLRFKQTAVLVAHTFAFTMSFMVWTMFGEIGVLNAKELSLNGTQFGNHPETGTANAAARQ